MNRKYLNNIIWITKTDISNQTVTALLSLHPPSHMLGKMETHGHKIPLVDFQANNYSCPLELTQFFYNQQHHVTHQSQYICLVSSSLFTMQRILKCQCYQINICKHYNYRKNRSAINQVKTTLIMACLNHKYRGKIKAFW